MASWTSQSTSSLLPGEPWTSAKALAAFENPEAIAEGASGAPVQTAAWHAYDRTNVGDSGTGKFYDHAVDGDQTTVETPNFENNYEYRILGRGIAGAGLQAVNPYLDYLISGTWYRATLVTEPLSSVGGDFDFWIKSPRRSAKMFATQFTVAAYNSSWTASGNFVTATNVLTGPTSSVVTRARIVSGAPIKGGDMYLLRRRED